MSEDNYASSGDAKGTGAKAEVQEFIVANAEYFTQALAPLNSIFRNSGTMNIVSEEADYTVVVGMKTTEEEGVMDVDCATLDADQKSIQNCINALFI